MIVISLSEKRGSCRCRTLSHNIGEANSSIASRPDPVFTNNRKTFTSQNRSHVFQGCKRFLWLDGIHIGGYSALRSD